MNTSKLYTLAQNLSDEHEEQVAKLLGGLTTALQNVVNSPNASTQEALTVAQDALGELLRKPAANQFYTEWKDALIELKINSYYGNALHKSVDGIFTRNAITTAKALSELQEFKDVVDSNLEHFAAIESAFDYWESEEDELEEGQGEISIAIPMKYFDSNMKKLGIELKRLNDDVLPPFVEAVGYSLQSFTITGISSSTPKITLIGKATAVSAIASATSCALEIYARMLEMTEKKKGLEGVKHFQKTVDQFKSDLNSLLKEATAEYAQRLLDELRETNQTNLQGRAESELRNQIANSLKKLVSRFDKGLTFTFRAQLHIPPKDEAGKPVPLGGQQAEDNKVLAKIIDVNKQLTFQNRGDEQIPELLEHIDAEETEDADETAESDAAASNEADAPADATDESEPE